MKFFETLVEQLKKEPNYVTDDGELKKWVVLNKAQNFDEELIELLLDNPEVKEKFFVKVKDVLIFNQNLFVQFLEQKNYLNNSYTQYKNNIGLTIDGKYLKQRNEVAIVWPYKDCVLEGGQSLEEDKREEIFFNEILAQDEITQLLEPKVLTNAKRIDKDGEKTLDQFNRNENGTITDNLIIKGNNLLALYTLKEEFAGKVKLIYIDPPYNRGGNADTFSYNNNFKHSSWLTFMRNRLTAAKMLLTPTGAIVVAIDGAEQCYLGVLLDEMFPNNEIHCITIIHNPGGNQGTNFSYSHEYAFFILPKGGKSIGLQNRIDNPDVRPLRDVSTGNHLRIDAKNCFYAILIKENEIIGFGEVCPDSFHPESANVLREDGVLEVYPIDAKGNERKWVFARQSVESIKDELKVEFNKNRNIFDIIRYKTRFNFKTVWTDKRYDANQNGAKLLKKLVPDIKFSFPKSLYTVRDCVYAVVGDDKNAIVLDYHAGSGTTAHAVLDLNKEDGGNRKFILCEQLEYIETVTSKRTQKVMQIQGEGNFVYLELKKYNQNFIDQIEEAKDTKQMLEIWGRMKAKSFLNYNVDIQEQEKHIEEFKQDSIENQKKLLLKLLDLNQLYVNRSSIEDEDFKCTEEEKALTKDFYGLKD
ncbi:MAG: type III restriction endonuclease subunit M [Ignavibacteriae bacterium HGW-Ignavibacteriae-4]|jgi:adenine-specific DNA-methyltransferase|nr:MAG: type III restriction endonuclease subunit M [Ignavibacteriae bacterium HGW-Ignavibacteriae-4]